MCVGSPGTSTTASSTHAFTVSSSFSAKFPLNRGSTKQEMSNTLFISSVYLSFSSRFFLIIHFICLVSVLPPSLSLSISLLMCSRTGFREESMTRFSEARDISELMGRVQELVYILQDSDVVYLGIRCHVFLSPASTPQMACCCSKNLEIIG